MICSTTGQVGSSPGITGGGVVAVSVAALTLGAVSGCTDDTRTVDDSGRANVSTRLDTTSGELDSAGSSRPDIADSVAAPNSSDATDVPVPGELGDSSRVTSPDGDADEGTDNCTDVDSDGDGLSDCEERRLCTDPHDGDTDGDHLGDFEEIQDYNSDPCRADTDGDGVSDKTEVERGLDPTRKVSFGDGTPDGERWVVRACDSSGPEPVRFKTHGPGNWTVALPPTFQYRQLRGGGFHHKVAAAALDAPANEISAFLMAKPAPSGRTHLEETIFGPVRKAIAKGGKLSHNFVGSQFRTHDQNPAVHAEYELLADQATSVRRLREDLLFALAPFRRSTTRGLPTSAGAQYRKFRVELALVGRSPKSAPKTDILLLAVAPLVAFDRRTDVAFRIDDLTNTTNIAEASAIHRERCFRERIQESTSRADFYWVLDDSGRGGTNMTARARSLAPSLIGLLRKTMLQFRLGVTNLHHKNRGRLFVPPGWVRKTSAFQREIDRRALHCRFMGGWHCASGTRESPLYNAMEGLRYMKGLGSTMPGPREQIRPDTDVYTISWVAEKPQGPKRQRAVKFLPRHTRAYFVVPLLRNIEPSALCGFARESTTGATYKKVARRSGGGIVDACRGNVERFLRTIIYQASGEASQFVLPEAPISNTLRVYLNGTWVPRSRHDGFDYFPRHNSIAFYGRFRPSVRKANNRPNDAIAVHYETFRRRCKRVHRNATCTP